MHNVRAFGAQGDRQASDRQAIQAAIDSCSEEDGVLRNVRCQPAGRDGQIPAVDLHDCQRVSIA